MKKFFLIAIALIFPACEIEHQKQPLEVFVNMPPQDPADPTPVNVNVPAPVVIIQDSPATQLECSKDASCAGDLPTTPVDGDIIKGSGDMLYFLKERKRYTIVDMSVFNSWFPSGTDIIDVSDEFLISTELAGNVVVRQGTFLVKLSSLPHVFAVEPKGNLRLICKLGIDESNCEYLFGINWTHRLKTVGDAFWMNYTYQDEGLNSSPSNKIPVGYIVHTFGYGYFYVKSDFTWAPITLELLEKMDFPLELVVEEPYGLPIPGYNKNRITEADLPALNDLTQQML